MTVQAIFLSALLLVLPEAAAQTSGEESEAKETLTASQPAKETPQGSAKDNPEQSDSPFDYEASEKISEDSAVSFPVDI